MSMEEKLLDFAFGARDLIYETERTLFQRGVKLIQARNIPILQANNTILLASPKFTTKVKIKDLSMFVRTAFTATGTITFAIRRTNDELVNIAGYIQRFTDAFGEGGIVLEPGEQIVIFKDTGASTDAGNFDANVDGEFT